MEKTIYEKIKDAVKAAAIPNVNYVSSWPADVISVDDSLTEDEDSDTLSPMLDVLQVITDVVKKNGTSLDDLEIRFMHLPGEEVWQIFIGDGR